MKHLNVGGRLPQKTMGLADLKTIPGQFGGHGKDLLVQEDHLPPQQGTLPQGFEEEPVGTGQSRFQRQTPDRYVQVRPWNIEAEPFPLFDSLAPQDLFHGFPWRAGKSRVRYTPPQDKADSQPGQVHFGVNFP